MLRNLRLGTLALFLVLIAGQAFAGGKILVKNETDQGVHPWFKNSCWNPAFLPPQNGWVFFGGIGPRGQFEWDFTGFSSCANPHIQFTYTSDANLNPPPDPADDDTVARFTWGTGSNTVIQIGERIRAIELGHPTDGGADQ